MVPEYLPRDEDESSYAKAPGLDPLEYGSPVVDRKFVDQAAIAIFAAGIVLHNATLDEIALRAKNAFRLAEILGAEHAARESAHYIERLRKLKR